MRQGLRTVHLCSSVVSEESAQGGSLYWGLLSYRGEKIQIGTFRA